MSGDTPRHIAFIMDGNGRWAARQSLPRIRGHERGADVLREITEHCCAEGLEELTFYALSTENYIGRPIDEVKQLMLLLERYLVSERSTIMEQNIRFRTVGCIHEFPDRVVEEIRTTEQMSCDNSGMILRLALNYGGRREITDAVRAIIQEIDNGRPAQEFLDLTEERFRDYFYDPEMTDPDLLVRTAGEYRLSNFLLWYISYAELWVTKTTWPDFDTKQLSEAIASYGSRERKYGTVSPTQLHQGEEEA